MAIKYINKKTGRKYKLTMATNSYTITMVKKQPNKVLIDDVNNKIYVIYNTEYRLPEYFIEEG